MRRLTIVLGALAILVSLGACGGSRPQQVSPSSSPSLDVKFDLTIPLRGHRIAGITLTPSGLPSGVVALATVHDGRVTTIGSRRFHRLNDTSFLVVQTSAHGVELGWNIQGAKSSCAVAFPAGSVWDGGSYGNSTLSAGYAETVWTLTRDVGATSATDYCVTITLDER
jgi:hypothetical protein